MPIAIYEVIINVDIFNTASTLLSSYFSSTKIIVVNYVPVNINFARAIYIDAKNSIMHMVVAD